jgi:hypothetical protein
MAPAQMPTLKVIRKRKWNNFIIEPVLPGLEDEGIFLFKFQSPNLLIPA